MKKRILSTIIALSVMSSVGMAPVYAENFEENSTPGIEQWAVPSGDRQLIEGVTFGDFMAAYEKENAYIYKYNNEKNAIVVTPDGDKHHFTFGNVWGTTYSVVTMREGTEPPVNEINKKIGSDEELNVVFYKYPESNEYRFYALNEEYQDVVFDILENNENVISIENRREIQENQFNLFNIYVAIEMTADEFINEYAAFDFEELKSIDNMSEEGYNSGFKFGNVKKSSEVYDAFIKLRDSGIKYEIQPLLAMDSGSVRVELVENVLASDNDDILTSDDIITGDISNDGKIDVSDLSILSLALLGDIKLTSAQLKAADVDGNGNIKLADLATLKQYISKQIDSLG